MLWTHIDPLDPPCSLVQCICADARLDATDLHPGACQSAEGTLSTGSCSDDGVSESEQYKYCTKYKNPSRRDQAFRRRAEFLDIAMVSAVHQGQVSQLLGKAPRNATFSCSRGTRTRLVLLPIFATPALAPFVP